MRMMKNWTLALVVGLVFAGGCGDSSTGGSGGTGGGSTIALTGAGSTFVNPAMSKWTYAYQEANKGVTINYQSVGSGAGIAQVKAGTVDFGASDVAMTDKELADLPAPVVQFPVIAGSEVLAYNLPGIQNGLKLSGDVIADMYLGKITKWNDPRIAEQNAGMQLPDLAITIVHRSDASGTSFIFTDYLSTVSQDWAKGPSKGKTVNWPAGVAGKGNEGVAGLVKQTPGAIGYVELAYAIQTKLSYGPIKNKSGNYVDPSIDSTTAAANAAMDLLKADIRTSIVDTSAPDGYPIAGFTYVIIPKTPKDPAKAKVMLDFFKWALGPGQDMAKTLNYAPLPKSIADLNASTLSTVTTK